MEINEDKLKRSILRAKRLISMMVRDKNIEVVGALEELSKEICLVVAGFKCQCPKCKNKEELVLHHLITRDCKAFMDLWRYLSQRHYWANQIILCCYCEDRIHGRKSKLKGKKCINEEKIRAVKIKYGVGK